MDPELWHRHPLLAWASLAPALLGAAWIAAAPRVPGLRDRRALLTALTWLATRVGFAVLMWGVLGHLSVDARTYFEPQAQAVLAGGLPYRDFTSHYGPLFAPLLAPAVAAFGALGPGIVFLAADLATWRLLAKHEGEASDAAWAWVALPVVWISTVRYAQDEALAALLLVLAWVGLRRGRAVPAGLALAAGSLATKPLFALPALAILAGAPGRRARLEALTAAAAPVALVLVSLAAAGADVFQPLKLEGANFGEGPTLWRVPVLLTGVDPGLWGWLPFALLAGWGLVRLLARRADPETHGAWQFAAFAALSPKFMPYYALMWMPLLAVWAGNNPRRRTWLAAEGTLLALTATLESGPLQGVFGAGWRALAMLVIAATAALALVPIGMIVHERERWASDGAAVSAPRPARS